MERLVPEPAAAAAFAGLSGAFERAAGRGADECASSYYRFGGHVVRVTVVGRALGAHIARPFAHLRIDGPPDAAPRLDLRLWDEQETGLAAAEADDGVGRVDGAPLTDIAVTGRFVRQRLSRSVAALDRHRGQLVGAVAWGDDVGVYQRGKPLARLLAEWYADQSVGLMHAGLVARGERGVLLAGREGAGKSTLALACVRAGLDFLGEDYSALEFLGDGTVRGHSVYNSAFLDPAAAAWFPELAGALTHSRSPGESKSVVLVADVWPSRLRATTRIVAMAICRVAGTLATRVRPASRSEALRAVAPSSLLSIHGRRADSLDRLARLVERVPCFSLDVGRDLASAVARVDELLTRA